MRHLLTAATVAGALLAAISPVKAKSIWLQCGSQEINLNSERERYSLSYANKIYQGSALFSPGQINFEYQWSLGVHGGGIKTTWVIDRKSLRYTTTSVTRTVLPGFVDTGWKVSNVENNPETGQCSIMKNPPTTGNQI